ncbi:GerMN domain-containing protein [Fusibacter tunisiensis]|uniref:GerMN domain-containing protein n=1 Tax=Fusibacter tunisiensis TaxID=1008308 RepID=A0ABS2MMX3_9FIRM|nr:GerMN domain-containing protein [Fusibacter tunisiensis]MBM7560734.1 hypothetical protein [Fusibacter tunisiensis]
MRLPYKTLIALVLCALVLIIHAYFNQPYASLTTQQYIEPIHDQVSVKSTLYYVFDGALFPYTANLQVKDGKYASAVIDQMKSEPVNTHYKTLFNFEVEVESIEIVNRTAYINFSEQMLSSDLMASSDLDLYIWSLVNSLTELKNVSNVQLMVSDQPITYQVSGRDLSVPLTRDMTLVYASEKRPSDAAEEFIKTIVSTRFDLSYALLSEESRSYYTYTEFVSYADDLKQELDAYAYKNHYTKRSSDGWEVLLKFSMPYNKDGFELDLYKKFFVIFEEETYKLCLCNHKD